VLGVVIAVGIVALLAAGFWWTRGRGGPPGGTDDPAIEAREQLLHGATPMGDHVDPLPIEHEDREHQIE
jgi:hypothetical protein